MFGLAVILHARGPDGRVGRCTANQVESLAIKFNAVHRHLTGELTVGRWVGTPTLELGPELSTCAVIIMRRIFALRIVSVGLSAQIWKSGRTLAGRLLPWNLQCVNRWVRAAVAGNSRSVIRRRCG